MTVSRDVSALLQNNNEEGKRGTRRVDTNQKEELVDQTSKRMKCTKPELSCECVDKYLGICTYFCGNEEYM